MFVIDDIAVAAAVEIAKEVVVEVAVEIVSEVATEVVSEIANEVVSEIANEVASEVISDVMTEVVSDAVSEVATDVVTETISDTVSEVATDVVTETISDAVNEVATDVVTETVSDAVNDVATDVVTETVKELPTEVISETTSETLTETISNVSPESIVDSQDISGITDYETNIIGDDVGEIQDMNSPDTSVGETTEVNRTEVDDISFDDLSGNSIDGEDSTNLEDTKDIENSPQTIKTINDGLVGQNHPDTGIPYVEKEVITDTGEKVKGVFPQFDAKVDIQLPEELQQAPDRTQFAECNKLLQEKIANVSELKSLFTEDQLADIEDGYTPEGYTWHHNEEIGKMQLVDTDIHNQTRHTGGRNIWGGGTENRH